MNRTGGLLGTSFMRIQITNWTASRFQITFIYLTSPSFAEQKKKKKYNEKTQTKITPPCPFWLPPSVYFIFLLLHLT